jgi:hypothetical protein
MILQKICVETGFFEMVGSTLSLHMSQVVYYVRAYLVETTGPNVMNVQWFKILVILSKTDYSGIEPLALRLTVARSTN